MNNKWIYITSQKNGSGWKAVNDESIGRYFGEYGGIQSYHLYEMTEEQYQELDEKMSEGDAAAIMYNGRHMYMSVDDRCGARACPGTLLRIQSDQSF